MEEVVYLNGKILPRSRASIPVYDQGFMYGYAVFETMRAYRGAIFRLSEHLKRLVNGAKRLGINLAATENDLARACQDTLKANALTEARLRLTVSRGEIEAFPGRLGEGMPTILITTRPYTPLSEEVYRKGFRAVVSSFRVNSQSPIIDIKSANYLNNTLARMEAEAQGFNEALLLNERGLVTEGSASNIFFVGESRLVTPALESGILRGITRSVVIETSGRLGISVEERNVPLDEVRRFSEAFLTNSIIELMPLVQFIQGESAITFGSGKPGEITLRLIQAYRELVRSETSG